MGDSARAAFVSRAVAKQNMNSSQGRAIVLFASAVALALALGWAVAMGNYQFLGALVGVVLFTMVVVTPGYMPLLVIGLLTPFSLPIPFIWNFPFLALTLGVALPKYFFERGLLSRSEGSGRSAMTISFSVFFSWVFFRYCLDPSIPNFIGFGKNVTGFRAWLSYGISFTLLLFLGRFVENRQGVLKLARWLAIVSFGFASLLIIVALSRSISIAQLFSNLGMFVYPYGNGVLRFVALGEFGLILISLVMLPNLLKLSRAQWWAVLLVGIAAVALSGSRAILGMAFIIIVTIPLLRKKYFQVAITFGTVLAISVVALVAGPYLSQLPHAEFLIRPLALISPTLAESTGADANMEWREAQWQIAWQQIQEHPMIGRGYGGVENAFDFAATGLPQEAVYEIDLATGGIHNGFIACALALGIPAALLFVYILARQIIGNAWHAVQVRGDDPVMTETHCFVCAHLLSFVGWIYVGSDVNSPIIWFMLGLGVFVSRIQRREARKANPMPALAAQALVGQVA
jgi:O-antigen ligase